MTGLDRKPWTDEDFGFIQDHDDWPSRRIAEALGRDWRSVQIKRTKLRQGWAPKREALRGWTKSEDSFLLAHPRMSSQEAAMHLRRSPAAVNTRRSGFLKAGLGNRFGGNWDPQSIGARPLLARTCLSCGLLLQAMWFSNTGRWKSTCTRCRNMDRQTLTSLEERTKSGQRHRTKMQALTTPGASSNGEPWTEADFAVLKDPDMTLLEKALTLKRTWSAAQGACRRYGYKSKVGLGDPERDQWKIDNPNADAFAV